jgi:uncharacterized protein YndB with AHSA1/START domain
MLQISGEIVIARPVEEVFALLADARNEPLYNPRILKAEKGLGWSDWTGDTLRTDPRSMGRAGQMIMEITEYLPPRRLSVISDRTGGPADPSVRDFRSASGAETFGNQ